MIFKKKFLTLLKKQRPGDKTRKWYYGTHYLLFDQQRNNHSLRQLCFHSPSVIIALDHELNDKLVKKKRKKNSPKPFLPTENASRKTNNFFGYAF